jgi:hypothetical protein
MLKEGLSIKEKDITLKLLLKVKQVEGVNRSVREWAE